VTTVQTPTPDPDDENAKAVVREAENIVSRERETIQVQEIFGLAAKVGIWLKNWRALMVGSDTSDGENGAFPAKWVDEATMTIFNQFFKPVGSVDEEELFDRMHEHFTEWHADDESDEDDDD
jgi:hypothetical protein